MLKLSGTFKDVLDRNRGIGPGFDLLRIALATIIFVGHVKWLTGKAVIGALPMTTFNPLEEGGWEGWRRPFEVSWVPAFFALSGFLVMGSAVRTRVTQTFLAYRALRIFPALVVELTLSALVLGLIFTRLPIGDYLTNSGFYRYFGNLVGWVEFELPGVFVNNHVQRVVNINLWTLPSEFDCYLISAALMLTGMLYRRNILTIIFFLLTIIFIIMNATTNFAVVPTTLAPYTVTYYFFMGVMFYHWRAYVPMNWMLFGLAVAAVYVFQMSRHSVYIAPMALTYCTLFIGMLPIPKIPIISKDDYSYGVYLYGFPITQATLALAPGLRYHQLPTFIIAGSLTFLFAFFSWNTIEKRCLEFKKHLPKTWFPAAERPKAETPKEREEVVAAPH